ncbi:uncharacterized protein V2V93DRAFT_110925 [Kockiozyma suomiensis]|uniref:uncharacterized protein n=1 Tax=Kockiozyma suomiensis TaxID=1337062 RepID=UPI00334344DD
MEILPSDEAVFKALIRVRADEPNLGIAKVHAKIKSLEPTWSLSLNRLRSIARSNASSLPETSLVIPENVKPKLYVQYTVSSPVPNLAMPPAVAVFNSSTRGKGLEITQAIPEATVIWTEPALVLIPPVSLAQLIPTGKACSFCAKPLGATSAIIVSCTTCSGRWCSSRCRKADKLHKALRHGQYAAEWVAIEQFASENQWSAVYIYAYVLAASVFEVIDDPNGRHPIKAGIDGLAKIGQDIRQKADPQYEQNIFMGEQFEIMWREGYSVICKFFAHFLKPSYEDFLYGIGMVNINNLDGSIYLFQSHLNHSCEPSVDVKIVGRTAGIKVIARRALAVAEELTTTYVDLKQDLDTRRKLLLEGWGFWCTCSRCIREETGGEVSIQADANEKDSVDTEITDVVADLAVSKKKKKESKSKSKSKSKKKVAEPERTRKKSVTFDETVVQIEI